MIGNDRTPPKSPLMNSCTSRTAVFNYVNPIVAPKDWKEELKYGAKATALGNAVPGALEHMLVSKRKKIQNARGVKFSLKNDGFQLLSRQLSLPPPTELENTRRRFFAMRDIFVPLAKKLAKEQLDLDPFYTVFTVPFYRKAASTKNLDNRDHNTGSSPHAMVHRYGNTILFLCTVQHRNLIIPLHYLFAHL